MSHDELHLCLAANRVQELGKVLLLACFNDERLGDYPSRSPSTVSHSYSLEAKIGIAMKRERSNNAASSVCCYCRRTRRAT